MSHKPPPKKSPNPKPNPSLHDALKRIEYPELFFGIAAPIGVDTKQIVNLLKESLSSVGYRSEVVKVTDAMKSVPTKIVLNEDNPEKRYDTYIRYANEIRSRFSKSVTGGIEGDAALAMLAVSRIRSLRKGISGSEKVPAEKQAYIIDQFKRPGEIKLFQRIYGRLFVLLSIHESAHNRKRLLSRKIKAAHGIRSRKNFDLIAEYLIARDQNEESVDHGQRVRDAFPQADVVIDGNDHKSAKLSIERIVNLLFGHNFVTPTRDEYGMYLAKSASLRSADLSRQVGAAIFSESSEIITLECNEVPKPGGGTYFEGDKNDLKDFVYGADYNEEEKKSVAKDLIERLAEAGLISQENSKGSAIEALLSDPKGLIGKSRVMDILEFGRQIHAEMSAIVDAARLGRSISRAVSYCTTFPCHMCAKLIIGSGIKRVVYIEPYPKSYATDMYSDSIEMDGGDLAIEKVIFSPFTGIAPFHYRDFFEKGRRKGADGRVQIWLDGCARPNINLQYPMYILFEPTVVAVFGAKAIEIEKRRRKY